MPDIFLYQGSVNPTTIVLSDPTKLRSGAAIIGVLAALIVGVGSIAVSGILSFNPETTPVFVTSFSDNSKDRSGATGFQSGTSIGGTPTQLMDIIGSSTYPEVVRLQAASSLKQLITQSNISWGSTVMTKLITSLIAVKSKQNPEFAYYWNAAQTLPPF